MAFNRLRKQKSVTTRKTIYHRDIVVKNLIRKNALKVPVIIAGNMAKFIFAMYSHLSPLTFIEPVDNSFLLLPVRTVRSGGLFFLLECDFLAFLDVV